MDYSIVWGQEDAKERLRQLVMKQRVPHALLLKGPPGSGALPLALAFAAQLLCQQKNEQGACGKCAACIKTAKLVHPDLHLVYPIQ